MNREKPYISSSKLSCLPDELYDKHDDDHLNFFVRTSAYQTNYFNYGIWFMATVKSSKSDVSRVSSLSE